MSKKSISVTTPFGKVEWFSLNKVDQFGNYTCTLHLEESPETLKLIDQIDELNPTGKKPYEKQADGSFKIRMKSKSKGTKKTGEVYKINPPVVYNAAGKKVEAEKLARLNVGNGSEMRAKLELTTYAMVDQETQEVIKGISSKVKSVQISKIVEFSGGDDFGFDPLAMRDDEEEQEKSGEPSKGNFDF